MTDQEPQRKKGGRPRKHSPDAKRPTMAFRMSSGLHEKLIASAEANERSLSEEIERRLEEGFTDHRSFVERFGGYNNYHLLATIASAWMLIEGMTKTKWTESQSVLDAMKAAAADVLSMVKPPNDREASNGGGGTSLSKLGEDYIERVLIADLGAGAAAQAVCIAKQIDVSERTVEFIVSAAYDFNQHQKSKVSEASCAPSGD